MSFCFRELNLTSPIVYLGNDAYNSIETDILSASVGEYRFIGLYQPSFIDNEFEEGAVVKVCPGGGELCTVLSEREPACQLFNNETQCSTDADIIAEYCDSTWMLTKDMLGDCALFDDMYVGVCNVIGTMLLTKLSYTSRHIDSPTLRYLDNGALASTRVDGNIFFKGDRNMFYSNAFTGLTAEELYVLSTLNIFRLEDSKLDLKSDSFVP